MIIAMKVVVGAVATCPPIISIFGSAGATTAGVAIIPGGKRAITAVGEGALAGVGSIFDDNGAAALALPLPHS
ncbi:hypothetical protein TWF281_010711 [Arthrobotrys megalospora]